MAYDSQGVRTDREKEEGKEKGSQQLRSRVVDQEKNPSFEGYIRSLRTRVVVAECVFLAATSWSEIHSKLDGGSSSAGYQNPAVKDRETGRWVVAQRSMTELSRNGGFGWGIRGKDGRGGRKEQVVVREGSP